MKAVKVPRHKAEEVRRFAESIGAKDKGRYVICRGEYVEIPIYNGFEKYFEVNDAKKIANFNNYFMCVVDSFGSFFSV